MFKKSYGDSRESPDGTDQTESNSQFRLLCRDENCSSKLSLKQLYEIVLIQVVNTHAESLCVVI